MKVAACQVPLPSGEQTDEDLQDDAEHLFELSHRHVAPSAPWSDFDADTSKVHPLPGLGQDSEWSHYPQSLFGTCQWARDQVERCCTHNEICSVHKVDVLEDGSFDKCDKDHTFKVEDPGAYWRYLGTSPPSNSRVRALFVENMTVPVLQILGVKYSIEPTFFTSSASWAPSRYQQDRKNDEDHITVILPFVRTTQTRHRDPAASPASPISIERRSSRPEALEKGLPRCEYDGQIIDTQAPLCLPGNRTLFQDLLAVHMHRTSATSTIISYHPNSGLQGASAKRLQSLVKRTSNSVYWSKTFEKSKDPTFLFLLTLWYAEYAWDASFVVLDHYINRLESDVFQGNDAKLPRKLHTLQAHLLHHQQLLEDFRLSVEFVRDTPNPAMNVLARTEEERTDSMELFRKEADNLLSEVERLRGQWKIMFDRVQNDIRMAGAIVTIEGSRTMRDLAMSKMLGSTTVKQVAYLAMILFPGTLLADVLKLKIREFTPGTAMGMHAHYVEAAVGLILSAWWLVMAFQQERSPRERGASRRTP